MSVDGPSATAIKDAPSDVKSSRCSDYTIGCIAIVVSSILIALSSIFNEVAEKTGISSNAIVLYGNIFALIAAILLDAFCWYQGSNWFVLIDIWSGPQRRKFFGIGQFWKWFIFSHILMYFSLLLTLIAVLFVTNVADVIAIIDAAPIFIPFFSLFIKSEKFDWKHRFAICFILILISLICIAEPSFIFGDSNNDNNNTNDDATTNDDNNDNIDLYQYIGCSIALAASITFALMTIATAVLKKLAFSDLIAQEHQSSHNHNHSKQQGLDLYLKQGAAHNTCEFGEFDEIVSELSQTAMSVSEWSPLKRSSVANNRAVYVSFPRSNSSDIDIIDNIDIIGEQEDSPTLFSVTNSFQGELAPLLDDKDHTHSIDNSHSTADTLDTGSKDLTGTVKSGESDENNEKSENNVNITDIIENTRVMKQSNEFIIQNDTALSILFVEYGSIVIILLSLLLSMLSLLDNGIVFDYNDNSDNNSKQTMSVWQEFSLYGSYGFTSDLNIIFDLVISCVAYIAGRIGMSYATFKIPNAPLIGILGVSDVLFGFVFSYFVLNQNADIYGIIGAVLIIFAIVVSLYPFNKHCNLPKSF